MIWLAGSQGMLGREIGLRLKQAGLAHIGTDMDLDITAMDKVRDFAGEHSFDWIINCAAYTNVDEAEKKPEIALAVNALGPANIARIAAERGIQLVHFSTDYVFDGKKQGAYDELDTPRPVSTYGLSKLEGEKGIKANMEHYYIFRISWLYGRYGNNFVKKMLQLFKTREGVDVVDDQLGAPTWCGALAENITRLIERSHDRYGLYHYQDEGGPISWYEFACEIAGQAKTRGLIKNDIRINPVPTSRFPTRARRPMNSSMQTEKTRKKLDFDVMNYVLNLKKFLDQMKTKQ